jgi:16S rRNA (adenine1518-N6/adenine1519-N6)-dimethyltransferase
LYNPGKGIAINSFELKEYLKKNHIWLKKAYGQHFLVEPKYLDIIVGAADVQDSSFVVEIGPGLGVLTKVLSDTATKGRILSLEADHKLVDNLREGIGNRKNVSIKQADALRFDWESLPSPYQVVANLPYQITSPLLHLLLIKTTNRPERITIMVQKEVAERLTAKPGSRDRGLTTVMVELTSLARIVTFVEKEAFFPPPQVQSAIIDILLKPKSGDEESILKTAKAGFSNKRRTLSNSLSGSLRLPKDVVNGILKETGIDPQRRAETLAIKEWHELTQVLERFQPKN